MPTAELGSPKTKETDFNWKYDSTKTESQYVLKIIRHLKCDFFFQFPIQINLIKYKIAIEKLIFTVEEYI